MNTSFSAPRWPRWVLVAAVLLAVPLRFGGIDWDQGMHLHPDERFLTMVVEKLRLPDGPLAYLDGTTSTLNPRNAGYDFFVYGTLPTTLVRVAAAAFGRATYDEIPFVGRVLSASVDLATVLLLFWVARLLYSDERIAALAALLYACSVLAIQHAHFFVVDPFATFFGGDGFED